MSRIAKIISPFVVGAMTAAGVIAMSEIGSRRR